MNQKQSCKVFLRGAMLIACLAGATALLSLFVGCGPSDGNSESRVEVIPADYWVICEKTEVYPGEILAQYTHRGNRLEEDFDNFNSILIYRAAHVEEGVVQLSMVSNDGYYRHIQGSAEPILVKIGKPTPISLNNMGMHSVFYQLREYVMLTVHEIGPKGQVQFSIEKLSVFGQVD